MQMSRDGHSQEPLQAFHRAVVLNPASAYNWANLADAEMNAGRVSIGKYCYQQAVKAGSVNPVISFRAANFAFAEGDTQTTLFRLRTILQEPELSAYYQPAFLTYSRLGLPIQQILSDGIPRNRSAAYAFLHFLMDQNKIQEAEATWNWIERNVASDDKLTADYVSFLIRENAPAEAVLAWKRSYVRDFPEYRNSNWVFNGAFAKDPKPAPLDWHLSANGDVRLTRLAGVGHDGGWTLQVQFSGKENVDFRQVSQTLVLSPGKWSMRGWLRTEGITTDSGLALHLFDPADRHRLDVWTHQMTGTNGWTLANVDFEIQSAPTLVTLEFARPASRKFDNKIAGTAWLGSVEVKPKL